MRTLRIQTLARIAIISCAALASWSCCTIARIADAYCHGVILIAVSSNLEVEFQKVTIHKDRNEAILWIAAPATHVYSIDITVKSGQKLPFTKCDPTSLLLCSIRCNAEGLCSSGPINPLIDPSHDDTYYAYVPTTAAAKGGDPGFIIK